MTENPNSMNTTKIASEFNSRKITDTKHADRLLDVDIIVRDNRWAENDGLEERLVDGIRKARSLGGKEFSGPEDIACVLTNDEEVRTLNSKFRDQDKPTNVLSFPSDQEFDNLIVPSRTLGDIVLAYETLMTECKELDLPFVNHAIHLVVHGTLHILGYDHDTEAESLEMESLEIKILSEFGIPNPYLN